MNVTLEVFDAKFVPVIQQYASKFENTKFTNVPYPYPTDGAECYQKYCSENCANGDSFEYVISCDGLILGMAGILDVKNENEVQIGYWLDQEFWNKGIGRRVVEVLLDRVERLVSWGHIYANVHPENPASMRILMINGFEKQNEYFLDEKHHKFPDQKMIRFKKVICDSKEC